MYVCMVLDVDVCMYVCIYVCMYAYVYVCINQGKRSHGLFIQEVVIQQKYSYIERISLLSYICACLYLRIYAYIYLIWLYLYNLDAIS